MLQTPNCIGLCCQLFLSLFSQGGGGLFETRIFSFLRRNRILTCGMQLL